MTSLALQLQKLRVPFTQTALAGRDHKRDSLLFDPKEAALMDREAVLALGINGLNQLIDLDPAFQEFESSLFDLSSLTYERTVQSNEANSKISALIRQFLVLLSPYFLLRPAHKALEWLINRYHIHQFDVDAIMLCILPYSDSRVFVRMVQLLPLSDTDNTRWSWLLPVQKSGTPLPVSAVATHCSVDPGFLNVVCNLVSQFIKSSIAIHRRQTPEAAASLTLNVLLVNIQVHGATHASSASSPLRVCLSFYANTITGCLEKSATNAIISQLTPHLVSGVKSPCSDYQAASYMIIVQLCRRAALSESFLRSLLPLLTKRVQATNTLMALSCVAYIYSSQDIEELPKRCFKHLCKIPGLVTHLVSLHKAGALQRLFVPFLTLLIPAAVRANQMPSSASEEGGANSDLQLGPPPYNSVLMCILSDLHLTKQEATLITKLVFKAYTNCLETTGGVEHDSTVKDQVRDLVQLLDKRYPVEFEGVLQDVVSDPERTELAVGAVRDLAGLSLHTGHSLTVQSEGAHMTLPLALNHPSSAFRLLASQQLAAAIEQQDSDLDKEFVRLSTKARLLDEDLQVASCLLQPRNQDILDFLSVADMLDVCKAVCKKVDDVEWKAHIRGCLSLLLHTDVKSLSEGVSDDILSAVAPFLIAFHPEDRNTVEECLKSKFFGSHPLLKTLLKSSKSSKKQTNSVWNSTVTTVLGTSLAKLKEQDRDRYMSAFSQSTGWKGCIIQLSLATKLVSAVDSCRAEYSVVEKILSIVQRQLPSCAKEPPSALTIESESSPSGDGDPDQWEMLCTRVKLGAPVLTPSVLMFYLRRVILSMQTPASTSDLSYLWVLPGSTDLDPVHDRHLWLRLLTRIFTFLSSMCISTVNPLVFQATLGEFLSHQLKSSSSLAQFLCMLWQSGPDQDVSNALQRRALVFFERLLLTGDVSSVVNATSVIASLLILLQHPECSIRLAAMSTIRTTVSSCRKASVSQELSLLGLLTEVIKHAEQVQVDAEHVKRIVSGYFSSLCSVSDLSAPPKKKKRTNSSRGIRKEMEILVDLVSSESQPTFFRHGLLNCLSLCQTPALLSCLVPVLDSLLQTIAKAEGGSDAASLNDVIRLGILSVSILGDHLATEKEGWPLLMQLLTINHPLLLEVLKQITKEFYSILPSGSCQVLLGRLFDLLTDSTDQPTIAAVMNIVKHLKLDAAHLVKELSLSASKAPARATVRKTASDRPRKEDAEARGRERKRIILILESLQHKKKLIQPLLLLPSLFTLLSRSSEFEKEEMGEYLNQLVLTCLTSVCSKLSPDQASQSESGTSDGESTFDMEVVVNCLRLSSSPQTHRLALQLLSAIANLYPDLVLRNLMPIFTFVGSNVMRHDDVYSFSVIGQTLDAIIPVLLKSVDENEKGMDVVSSVARVFVSSYSHVPEHRRVTLYGRLAAVLGEGRYLAPLLILFCEKEVSDAYKEVQKSHQDVTYPDGDGRGETVKTQTDQEIYTFLIKLINHFPAAVCLHTLQQLVDYILTLPDQITDSKSKSKKRVTKGTSKASGGLQALAASAAPLFDLTQRSGRDLRHFKYIITSLVGRTLADQEFVGKIMQDKEFSVQPQFESFLQSVLQFVMKVAKCTETYAADTYSKYWRSLSNKAYDILNKGNGLLPDSLFPEVVKSLMVHPLIPIRKKAMELLTARLAYRTTAEFTNKEMHSLVALVSVLSKFLINPLDQTEGSKMEEVKDAQVAALRTLRALCSLFAFNNVDKFEELLPLLIEQAEKVPHHTIHCRLLLCLAELSGALKVKVIAYLPRLMPLILQVVEGDIQGSPILWQGALIALQKVVEAVPHFMSPYLTAILRAVISGADWIKTGKSSALDLPTATTASTESSTKQSLVHKLDAVKERVSLTVTPRVFLSSVSQCYDSVKANPASVEALMGMMLSHVNAMAPKIVTSFSRDLSSMMFLALSYRLDHTTDPLETTAVVEDAILAVLVAMVMKLSEANFRPIFFKLYDWACHEEDGKSSKERHLVFYRLSYRLVSELKGLFNPFVGHSLQHAATLLQSYSFTDSARSGSEAVMDQRKSLLLLTTVTNYLQKSFLYASEDLVDKARFDLLMPALVDQVEISFQETKLEQEEEVYVSDHLLPCIGRFVIAVEDDSYRKQLNYQVCLKSRSHSAKVRKRSLMGIREICSKLGENYVGHLPETVQFLAELIEDDSREISDFCRNVIVDMEQYTGEDLQKYF